MKGHIDYIDNAKGILIVLVVLGHILPNASIVKQFIYIFHMPAFFLISGVLIRYSKMLDRPLWKTILKKVYSLIVPYFSFEVIAILVDIAQHGVYQNIKGYIFDMLTLNTVNYVDWFLPVLFLGEICFTVIHKCIRSEKACVLLGAAAALCSVCLAWFHSGAGMISKVLLCYGFLTLGFYGNELLSNLNIPFAVMSPIAVMIVALLTDTLGIGNIATPMWALFLFGSIAGTYCVIQISKLKWSSIFRYYGRNSLIIMGTHVPLLSVIMSYIYSPLGITYDPWSSGMAAFAIILILEIPIIFILNRCLPFAIGKKINLQCNRVEQ